VIPLPRKTTVAIHPAAALLLATALGGPNCDAATVDYPPPPGAYRSEPLVLPGLTPPPAAAEAQHRPDDTRPTGADPAGSGAYGADRLFGSAQRRDSDDRVASPQRGDTRQPQTMFAPPSQAADGYPEQAGFTVAPGAQPFAGGYYEQGAVPFQGYPEYAPAYPGYAPYPGQGMEFAPPAGASGYYAPAFPQQQYPAADPFGQGGSHEPPTAMSPPYPMSGPDLPLQHTGTNPASDGQPIFRPPGMLPTN